jgi:hypothetical protein
MLHQRVLGTHQSPEDYVEEGQELTTWNALRKIVETDMDEVGTAYSGTFTDATARKPLLACMDTRTEFHFQHSCPFPLRVAHVEDLTSRLHASCQLAVENGTIAYHASVEATADDFPILRYSFTFATTRALRRFEKQVQALYNNNKRFGTTPWCSV